MTGSSPGYTLQDIATNIGAGLRCVDGVDGAAELASGVATLAGATPSEIAFLANPRYRAQLAETRALAVIVHESVSGEVPVNALVHEDPYRAYAELTQLFEARPSIGPGVDPTVQIAGTAKLGQGARVAAGAVIHEQVMVGDGAEISANVVIEQGVVVGDNVFIGPNVTLCHGIKIGNDVRIQSGTVIGSEGFGYAPYRDKSSSSKDPKGNLRWQRIAQLGSVVIGDRVEIGANTSIDRGVLDDTVIEDDVIIDNQVQVAHNVKVGRGTAIAGCVGIAGSATIGKECSIGGGAGIAGHLSIADGTTVLGMTLINRSVNQPGAYASGTGMQEAAIWRKNAVRFTQLEALNKRVKALEKKLDQSTDFKK